MRGLAIVLVAALLSACGFHLRGSYSLPWETLHISLPEFDILRAEIKRNIEAATQTRIVADRKEAQATLVISRNDALRSILSLDAKGNQREIQLTRVFVYSLQDDKGKALGPAGQIVLQRDMTYDENLIYAKQGEEAMIQREMQDDLVQQLMRRLAAFKPEADRPATPVK
jgi:LPS-assembly lipoprotein